MARYRVSYSAYPSSKEATEYSKSRATNGFYAGGVVNMMIIGAVIWYIYGVIGLFGKLDIINYLESFSAITVMSWLTLYFYVLRSQITDRECKLIIIRENASRAGTEPAELKSLIAEIKSQYRLSMKESIKSFFSGFIPAFISGTGLIGAIKSVYMLCHEDSGLEGLIISLVIIASCVAYYVAKYASKASKPVIHEINRNETNAAKVETSNMKQEMLYCRKCGNRIYPDSVFCSKCGTEIIR